MEQNNPTGEMGVQIAAPTARDYYKIGWDFLSIGVSAGVLWADISSGFVVSFLLGCSFMAGSASTKNLLRGVGLGYVLKTDSHPDSESEVEDPAKLPNGYDFPIPGSSKFKYLKLVLPESVQTKLGISYDSLNGWKLPTVRVLDLDDFLADVEAVNYRYYIIGPQTTQMSEDITNLIRFKSLDLVRISRVAITAEHMNTFTCLAHNVQPPCCIATPYHCGFRESYGGQLQEEKFSLLKMFKEAIINEVDEYNYKGPHLPEAHHSVLVS